MKVVLAVFTALFWILEGISSLAEKDTRPGKAMQPELPREELASSPAQLGWKQAPEFSAHPLRRDS